MEHFYEEEALTGKVDPKLVLRLSRYLKPYIPLGVFALFVVLLGVVLQLAMPYLTKMAIDSHITPSQRLIVVPQDSSLADTGIEAQASWLDLGDGRWLASAEQLRRLGGKELSTQGWIAEEQYYLLQREGLSTEEWDAVLAGIEGLTDGVILLPDSLVLRLDRMGLVPEEIMQRTRQEDRRGLEGLVLLFVIFLVVNAATVFTRFNVMGRIGQGMMRDLRRDVFSHILCLPMTYFDTNPSGRLVTRVANDVNSLQQLAYDVVVTLFSDLFLFLGIAGVLIWMNPSLALATFIVLPLVVGAAAFFGERIRGAWRVVRARLSALNAMLAEHISGIKVTQLFCREEENARIFAESNHSYFTAGMRRLTVESFFSPVIELLQALGIAIILWYGGGKVIRSTLTLGELAVFIAYAQMFFRPLVDLAHKYNIFQGAMASAERLFQIMDTPPESGIEGTAGPERIDGVVEFKDVCFAYKEGEYVLNNVSFKAEKGQTIALVGATGSGKTTIASLITRFYDPQKGTIEIDGIAGSDWGRRELRSHIGVVMQDVFLFSGDVKRNIRLNREEITEERLDELSQTVNAHTFIDKLEGRYDAEVQERGATLSTGQRQLISFARALAFDPEILILDEATANIDTETEVLIQEALQRLMKGRTSIVIAHRLSTIRNADKILVMSNGRIVESGTHDELMREQGMYYQLHEMQDREIETERAS